MENVVKFTNKHFVFNWDVILASLKGSDMKQTVLDEQVVHEKEFGTRWERLRYLTQIYANLSRNDVEIQP